MRRLRRRRAASHACQTLVSALTGAFRRLLLLRHSTSTHWVAVAVSALTTTCRRPQVGCRAATMRLAEWPPPPEPELATSGRHSRSVRRACRQRGSGGPRALRTLDFIGSGRSNTGHRAGSRRRRGAELRAVVARVDSGARFESLRPRGSGLQRAGHRAPPAAAWRAAPLRAPRWRPHGPSPVAVEGATPPPEFPRGGAAAPRGYRRRWRAEAQAGPLA
jgi:hypothetical protein